MRKIRRLKRIERNTLNIGIDRVVFKTLNLKSIDAKLLRRSFQVVEGGDIYRVMLDKTGEELKVNCIKVKSSEEQPLQITSLDVGVKKIKTVYKPYEYLDVTLPKLIDKKGLNTSNIHSLANFKKSLKKIEEELKYIGFSDVDLSRAQIEEIEINVNVPLQRDFHEYEGALEYLKSLLPKTLRKGQSYEDRLNNEYTGFLVKNNSVSVKFYDKRKNVLEEHKTDIGHELLRIEYRLLKAEKVKGFLGTIEVNDLLKNFDAVAQSFKKGLEKDMLSKIQSNIDQQIKDTVKVLKEYKSKYKSKYIAQAVSAMGTSLLDYEILKRAFEIVEEGKNKSTLKNNLTLIRAKLREKEGLNNIEYFGVIDKINEILVSLGYEKIVIKK